MDFPRSEIRMTTSLSVIQKICSRCNSDFLKELFNDVSKTRENPLNRQFKKPSDRVVGTYGCGGVWR